MRSVFNRILCLLLVCALLPAAVWAEALYTPAGYPLSWYQQQAQNADPTQAFVQVIPHETPVRLAQNAAMNNELCWYTAFDMQEVNGVPFTLVKQTVTGFDEAGNIVWQSLYADQDIFFYDGRVLENGKTFTWGALAASNGTRWYALCLEGVDANGSELAFGGLIELLDEVRAVPVRAEFEAEPVRVDGKPFLEITCPQSPVRYVESLTDMPEEPGWEFTIVYENTGDSAFTLTHMEHVFFDGDEFAMDSAFRAETVAEWRGEGGVVFQPGDRWEDSNYQPMYEGFDTLFIRVTGTDESGEELSFTGRIDLVRQPQ